MIARTPFMLAFRQRVLTARRVSVNTNCEREKERGRARNREGDSGALLVVSSAPVSSIPVFPHPRNIHQFARRRDARVHFERKCMLLIAENSFSLHVPYPPLSSPSRIYSFYYIFYR